jgi:hypothetical protein
LDWKDTLLAGGSRQNLPWAPGTATLPGYASDGYGAPIQRNDWVAGPGGVPVISGSSEQQGGPMTPSPGFEPVDAGQYGANPWFAGRGAPSVLNQVAGQPAGALSAYSASSGLNLEALLRVLAQLAPGSPGVPVGGGGLRIAE